jgi:hypothetical protein
MCNMKQGGETGHFECDRLTVQGCYWIHHHRYAGDCIVHTIVANGELYRRLTHLYTRFKYTANQEIAPTLPSA